MMRINNYNYENSQTHHKSFTKQNDSNINNYNNKIRSDSNPKFNNDNHY